MVGFNEIGEEGRILINQFTNQPSIAEFGVYD